MNKIKFFKEGLKNMRTVGTVTPSSKYLCQAMIKGTDFAKARILVELGAGDGVVTRHILKRMHPDAKLLAFEVQPAFCDLLRSIDDARLIVVEDSAENLPLYLKKLGAKKADQIISAIPFVLLPKEEAQRIVEVSRDHLVTEGQFVQIHYSTFLKPFYQDIFDRVKINFCPLNIPPAFVFHCSSTSTN
jgi:phospholipid N-methyltransferase